MNKIRVVEENVEELKLSKKVTFEMSPAQNEFDISSIHITILKNCDLELDLTSSSKKLKVNIDIKKGANAQIYLYQRLENSKVQYNYQVCGSLKVFKFNVLPVGKEMMSVRLLEEESSMEFTLKDICSGKETLDYYIYHDAKNTNSNIKNNIVSVHAGKVAVQVSTFIPKGKIGCIANQNNRIISLNEKKNEIRPNLYIDEYDVVANHSALIGKFSGEELFYLQSRGISKEEATGLLLKGFLLSDIVNKKMQKEINNAIKNEWR